MSNFKKIKISVIGLGYVGLPLALAFGKKFKVVGFDLKKDRINDLKEKKDTNFEIKKNEFNKSLLLTFSNNQKDIKDSNVYIVTVPTPIKKIIHQILSTLKVLAILLEIF